MNVFQTFNKKRDFLVCIDSDGCAMDTMDIKHIQCFGPCMVETWHLETWQEPILRRWNEINLYTMTRGINRFKALAMALAEVNEQFCHLDGVEELILWTENARELSHLSLEMEIRRTGSLPLKKALEWSVAVNRSIAELPKSASRPFAGVRAAIAQAHLNADIAIVSSANPEAVEEEWERHGLMDDVDIMLAQDAGSKAFCIGEMLKMGYEPDHVLMVGDAPGDRDAAVKNGVLFYPILVRQEERSWENFLKEGLGEFLDLSYRGVYQERLMQEFEENLSGN